VARVRTQQPVLPSLLDRLIDDDPMQVKDASKPVSTLLKDIKANIRRDLENLLNTRIYNQTDIDGYKELDKSVINYGLPDFSREQLEAEDNHHVLTNMVEIVIDRYEPRFKRVQVEINPIGDEHERTLYLKISAVLMVEPDSIPLIFDSRIRTVDRSLKLREVDHG
jgi:type VI secretion system protein ImpF